MFFKLFLPLCLLHVRRAIAADCNSTQLRPNDSPSGAEIQIAINNDPQTSNACGGLPLNATTANWTHGGMVLTFSKASFSTVPQHCSEALKNIIDECIVSGNYFGGSWSTWNESYSIYNQQYPENPLLPQDQGGLSSTEAASSSTRTASISESLSRSSTASTSVSSSTLSSVQTRTSSFGDASSSQVSSSSESLRGSTISHSSNDGETVVTNIIYGSTITATFDPTRISEYESLSSTITTTTTRDGTPIPFVIFPGGWAWFNINPPAGIIPTPPPGPPAEDGGNNQDPTTEDASASTGESSSTSTSTSSTLSTPTSSLSSLSSTTSSLSSSTSSSACSIGTVDPGFPWQFGDYGVLPTSYLDSDQTTSTGSLVSSSSSNSDTFSATSLSTTSTQLQSTSTSQIMISSRTESEIPSTTLPSSSLVSASESSSVITSSASNSPTMTPSTTTSKNIPSCKTVTSAGAVCTLCEDSVDPACDAIGPPAPTQTSSNNKGSALCKSAISGDDCKRAYRRYDENRVYNAYTSYTFTNYDDPINVLLPADDGCTAIFTCDTSEAYATGMAGWAIIAAFDYMYANDKVKTCGSAYLDNGCHITANGCSGCKDVNT